MIAGITNDPYPKIGIEQVVALVNHGLRRGRSLRDVGSFCDQPLEFHHSSCGADARHELLERLAVHQKIAGIDIERNDRLLSAEQFFLVIGGDVNHAVYLPVVEKVFGLVHVAGFVGHIDVRSGIEGIDQLTAGRSVAHVDYSDRHVTKYLRPVSQRIERGIDQQGEHQHENHAGIREDRAVFVADDGAELLPVRGYLFGKSTHRYNLPQYFLFVQMVRRRGRHSSGRMMNRAMMPMSGNEYIAGAPRRA